MFLLFFNDFETFSNLLNFAATLRQSGTCSLKSIFPAGSLPWQGKSTKKF